MKHFGRIALAVCITCCACVQKSKRLSKAEREEVAQIVSSMPPHPSHPLDIRFGNKIKLLGYDVSQPQVHEGRTFTVTWYWQVDQPLGRSEERRVGKECRSRW